MHRNSPGHSCTSHSIPNPTHITKPITSPLTPRCHCWGLFIITAAGDATGKPQPRARGMKDGEEEKGAQQHKADPSPRWGGGLLLALPGLCHCHTSHPGWDPLEHSCGSWSRCWGLSSPHTLLPLSLTLCSVSSWGERPVVHQPGLAGGAQPAGRCHGRPALRGLPAAPQEEVSPPAQEVQPPPVTEFGILELAAK